MQVQAKGLKRIPLNVVFIYLPTAVEKVISHDELETSKVVEASDDQEAKSAKRTEQSSKLGQEIERGVDRAEEVNLVEGDFVGHCVMEEILVRQVTSRFFLDDEPHFCFRVSNAPVAVFEVKFLSRNHVYFVVASVRIERVPVGVRSLEDTLFAKLVLDEMLFVCQ